MKGPYRAPGETQGTEKRIRAEEREMRIKGLYNDIYERLDSYLESKEYKESNFLDKSDLVLNGIKGKNSEEVWKIREKIDHPPRFAIWNIKGLDSEKAWKLREDALKDNVNQQAEKGVLLSLEGLDSEKAWELRRKYKNEHPYWVMLSLKGVDDGRGEAQAFRKEILEDYGDHFFEGAQSMRVAALRSIEGLDSEWDWEIRDRFLERFKFSVIESLSGIDTKRAWKIRKKYKYKHSPYNREILLSLKNIASKKSWKWREEFKSLHPEEVTKSIEGLDLPEAWKLRDESKDRAPLNVAHSLGGLEDTDDVLLLKEYLLEKHKDDVEILAALLK